MSLLPPSRKELSMTSRSFWTFEAVASIWFNGSCEANHVPDHSEATMAEDTAEGLKDAIRVDTAELRGHVDAVVRSSVEETLNALLQAEADVICGATRYERSPERMDTRAGSYERKLETKAGVVTRRCRSCVHCRSKRRSSSAIGAASRRSRKRWWKCIWQE